MSANNTNEAYKIYKEIHPQIDKTDTLYNYVVWYYIGATAQLEKEAGIKEKKVLYYPLVKEDKFGEILEQLEESEEIKASSTPEIPKSLVHYYNQLKKLESYQGIQMRMPYEITIN